MQTFISLAHLETLNSRRRIRAEQANRLAPGVIPRSGGADLWKHRALNRGGRGRRARKRKMKKKIVAREMGTGPSAAGVARNPEKCGDKRDEARRRALERSGPNRGLIAEEVEEVCAGAFTEEKLSCSLVEKIQFSRWTANGSAHSARPSSRGECDVTRAKKTRPNRALSINNRITAARHWSEPTRNLASRPAFTEDVLPRTLSRELPGTSSSLYIPFRTMKA